MAILLSDGDVRRATDMSAMIDMLDGVFRLENAGGLVQPERLNIMEDGDFLRLMPVRMSELGLQGYKSFHGSLANGVRYLVVAMSTAGEFLGLLDSAYLTAARTGATSGLATRYMTPNVPVTVGVLGSGLEAETNLTAVATVRSVKAVKVYSRSPTRRETFAERMSEELGLQVDSVESPKDAVTEADVVIVATNTGMNGAPAYSVDWMRPGQFMISIGSTSPFLRELESECFAKADTVVFDTSPTQVLAECGDLLAANEVTQLKMGNAQTLAGVVAGEGLSSGPSGLRLFKSVGSAAQDIAAAKTVIDSALRQGLGIELGEIASSKRF